MHASTTEPTTRWTEFLTRLQAGKSVLLLIITGFSKDDDAVVMWPYFTEDEAALRPARVPMISPTALRVPLCGPGMTLQSPT